MTSTLRIICSYAHVPRSPRHASRRTSASRVHRCLKTAKSYAHPCARLEEKISAAPSSTHKDQGVAENEPSTGQRMMPCSRAGRSGASKSSPCFSPARKGGEMSTAALRGIMVISWTCWARLSILICKVGVYAWQLHVISRHAPNQY